MFPGARGGPAAQRKYRVGELPSWSPVRLEKYARVLPATAALEGAAPATGAGGAEPVHFHRRGMQFDRAPAADLKDGEPSWKLKLEAGRRPALSTNWPCEDFPARSPGLENTRSDGQTLEYRSAGSNARRTVCAFRYGRTESRNKASGDIAAPLALEGLKDFRGRRTVTGSGDLNATLNLSRVDAALETWRVSGTVTAGEIAIELPVKRYRPQGFQCLQLKLSGRDLERATLTAVAGGSDLLTPELSVSTGPVFSRKKIRSPPAPSLETECKFDNYRFYRAVRPGPGPAGYPDSLARRTLQHCPWCLATAPPASGSAPW